MVWSKEYKYFKSAFLEEKRIKKLQRKEKEGLVRRGKKLTEREGLFKAATSENLENRGDQRAKELYDNAEKAIPGVVERLRQKFRKVILIQTAIVYGDSGPIEDLLGKTFCSICDLNWNGYWKDGKTFIEQCEIIGRYNNFDVDVAKKIVEHFPDREFRLGREYSVVVYIRSVTKEEYKVMLKDCGGRFKEDRTNLVDGNILRVKW